MSVNYGSKRIVVGAHYGLRDWLAQRITAALMALFTLALVVQVLLPGSAPRTTQSSAGSRRSCPTRRRQRSARSPYG